VLTVHCDVDYCMKMSDGQYHDPWNPYCGFIQCSGGSATRRICQSGTWMGMNVGRGSADRSEEAPLTINDICRRKLKDAIEEYACIEQTALRLCKNVEIFNRANVSWLYWNVNYKGPPPPSFHTWCIMSRISFDLMWIN